LVRKEDYCPGTIIAWMLVFWIFDLIEQLSDHSLAPSKTLMVEVGRVNPTLTLWWMFQFWRSMPVASSVTTPVGRLVVGSPTATLRISYPSVKDLGRRQRLAEAVLV
jgi:hypothetical protein